MSKRFNQFTTITARFDSIGTCGHPIKQGDSIGWARARFRGDKAETQCAQCWCAWQAENAEAQAMEDHYNQHCG